MHRVVFDTVVFVRSLINPYGRWGELVFYHGDKYQLFVSPLIIEEILEVLHRPIISKKFRTDEFLSLETVIELLGKANVVEISEMLSGSRDAKDNKFLAAAVAAKADYLVSEDQDLLIIKNFKGVKIVDSLAFLKILKK